MTTIDAERLRPLGMGAAVLSAGGGSFPYHEVLHASRVLAERGAVPLISADAIADDMRVVMVAMVGAPLVMQERLVDVAQFVHATTILSRHLGHGFDAVMGAEIGSLNAIIPVLVAADLGLPLVDADTLGRSFPQIDMSNFLITGASLTPMALADIRGNEVVIPAAENGPWVETLVRAVTTEYGSMAGMASGATGRIIRRHALKGTYSRAVAMGEVILAAQAAHRDVVEQLLSHMPGVELVRGRVRDVDRRIEGGFVRGEAIIAPTDGSESMRLMFQNEYTVAMRGDRLQSTVPDLLCLFDTVRGEPIGTESLRYAQQVSVVSFPAMVEHLTPNAIAAVGPRAFGYEFDHHTPHAKVI
ncbi:DUF917 domain-containing protein [Flavisphingomonas formosensis]|uniref:DUF917 domain-containing protein n=1 Tax=Flavisphingomonas formosensis TaxID=861534 RepID=UPI0012FBB90A|nr:DUF917 domain-containing protein [Sphingomonas formosensis]